MPPIIPHDLQRINSLRELRILDTPRRAAFDQITAHCADLYNCSMAFISLVDEHRQWFLSSVGVNLRETPRDIAFCDHTIASGKALLVSDATKDERFFDNPLVRDTPSIRSYLGTPIKSPDGSLIGTYLSQTSA